MDLVVLFHNSKAGESVHLAEELVTLIRNSGYRCDYVSLKDTGWENFDENAAVLMVAGGDGTVRAVIGSLLLKQSAGKNYTIGLIPAGTANNISKTLNIPGDAKGAVGLLQELHRRNFDIGRVEGLPQTDYFIEGMGVGIFPGLIRKMDKIGNPDGPVEERLALALEMLAQIVETFEPIKLKIVADGVVLDGDYLMAEVMNTKSIGPNLVLAADADTGDGLLDLVLIPAGHRSKLLRHVRAMRNGQPDDFSYQKIAAREINIYMPNTWLHVDDEVLKYEEGELRIYVAGGIFKILTPTA